MPSRPPTDAPSAMPHVWAGETLRIPRRRSTRVARAARTPALSSPRAATPIRTHVSATRWAIFAEQSGCGKGDSRPNTAGPQSMNCPVDRGSTPLSLRRPKAEAITSAIKEAGASASAIASKCGRCTRFQVATCSSVPGRRRVRGEAASAAMTLADAASMCRPDRRQFSRCGLSPQPGVFLVGRR